VFFVSVEDGVLVTPEGVVLVCVQPTSQKRKKEKKKNGRFTIWTIFMV
jgi:hypothetical protein